VKKLLLVFGLLVLALSLFTGCTHVKEYPVDAQAKPFTDTKDLSKYQIQPQAPAEQKLAPKDPSLTYVDTDYMLNLMAGVSKTSSTRKTYNEYVKEWPFVLIDARPSGVFAAGHINGSINIPAAQFNEFQNLLPADKEKLLIFYCGGVTCHLSTDAALKAKALGYTNIKVYYDGVPGWQAAGNALVVTDKYVESLLYDSYVTRADKKPYLIIDARPYSLYFNEHIPNAVQMDDVTFMQKYLAMAPVDKSTEIITYCGGFSCLKSHNVAQYLVNNGYTNVKVFAGGIPVWDANGLPTFGVKGKVGDFNVAAGKVNRALTPDQFVEKLTKGTNVVVLDVRTDAERAAGAIKGSIHIPDSVILADPKAIADKLPKDKNTTILIHCASGARAGGVVDKVADLGYPNTFYLNNKITIAADGTYKFD